MKYTYSQVHKMYDAAINEGENYIELAEYAHDAARVIGTIENALKEDWRYSDIISAIEWALSLGGEPENTEGL